MAILGEPIATLTLREPASGVRAIFVLDTASLSVTPEAEPLLHGRGIAVVPDFVANAGAAIGCAMLWYGPSTPDRIIEDVGRRLRAVTREVLDAASRSHVLPRHAAEAVAIGALDMTGVAKHRAGAR